MTDDLCHEVSAPRSSTADEWEVFASEETDPVRHVGSVTAPTRDVAVEQARQLFAWSAETLWLCPAAETTRLTTAERALGPTDGETPPQEPTTENASDP